MRTVKDEFAAVDQVLKKASVASPAKRQSIAMTSGFGGAAFGRAGEKYPTHEGENMFCLFRLVVRELPFRPPELEGTELLEVFLNIRRIPEDTTMNGVGWEIREYSTLEDLVPMERERNAPLMVRDAPVSWILKIDDAPRLDDAQFLLDLEEIIQDDDAIEEYSDRYNFYHQTKVSGYPFGIQHATDLDNFVFQIGADEKAQWMWGDNGVAYFYKTAEGKWHFTWQCY